MTIFRISVTRDKENGIYQLWSHEDGTADFFEIVACKDYELMRKYFFISINNIDKTIFKVVSNSFMTDINNMDIKFTSKEEV